MTVLEAERKSRAWTQTALAFHAEVTQGEISKFERRQAVPRPGQTERLARVLGVPADVLLREVRGPGSASEPAEVGRRG